MRADLGVRTQGITPNQCAIWENQVLGFSANASQATGNKQPVQVVGQNGRAALRFVAASAQVLSWSPVLIGPKTIVVVAKMTTEPHTGFSVYTLRDPTTGDYSEFILDLAAYQYVSFVDDWTSTTTMFGHNDTYGTSLVHASIHTYSGGAEVAGSYTARLEGAAKTPVVSGAYASTLVGAIGARSDNTFPCNLDLYEIIMYNRVLSASEQDQLVGYTTNRYALSF